MSAPVIAVVLAAGLGTRMRSPLAKVLHPLLGRPMVGWVVQALLDAGAAPIAVVNHQAEAVQAALDALSVGGAAGAAAAGAADVATAAAAVKAPRALRFRRIARDEEVRRVAAAAAARARGIGLRCRHAAPVPQAPAQAQPRGAPARPR
jgi:CTP:molybdopterin cytidylyltransferase MocA